MKKLYFLIIFFLMLNLCGCASLIKSQIGIKENKLQIVGTDIDERSRQLTTAVFDISDSSSSSNPEMALIKKIAQEDQRIEGLPIQKLDISYLLGIGEREQNRELQAYIDENTRLLCQRHRLKTEISTLEQKLITHGFWGRIIRWIGIPGLIIALVVFFPTAILPILSFFVGWVTSVIPSLIGFLGVVSKRVVDNIVSGVQQAREELKKNPEKTYKAKDVLQMLDQNLSAEQDQITKKIVRKRKFLKKYNS